MFPIAVMSTFDTGVLPVLLLYVGPDVLLPLTSVLAAIAGVALMFWQRLVGAARSIRRTFSRKP